MPRLPRRALIAALVLLACLPACISPKGGSRRSSRIDEAWPYAPVRVQIHSLTRFVRAGADPEDAGHIEAHIEFLDRNGDPVKGVGTLLIELYRLTGPVEGVGAEEQITRWNWNLSDPANNKEAYDRVTRTYRLKLTSLPISASTGESLELRASLTAPGGLQMSDRYRLRLEGQPESAAAPR